MIKTTPVSELAGAESQIASITCTIPLFNNERYVLSIDTEPSFWKEHLHIVEISSNEAKLLVDVLPSYEAKVRINADIRYKE